jgi:hypothetical protein
VEAAGIEPAIRFRIVVCMLYKLGRGINSSINPYKFKKLFTAYGRSYQLLAVGTYAKSARDLEIILR